MKWPASESCFATWKFSCRFYCKKLLSTYSKWKGKTGVGKDKIGVCRGEGKEGRRNSIDYPIVAIDPLLGGLSHKKLERKTNKERKILPKTTSKLKCGKPKTTPTPLICIRAGPPQWWHTERGGGKITLEAKCFHKNKSFLSPSFLRLSNIWLSSHCITVKIERQLLQNTIFRRGKYRLHIRKSQLSKTWEKQQKIPPSAILNTHDTAHISHNVKDDHFWLQESF